MTYIAQTRPGTAKTDLQSEIRAAGVQRQISAVVLGIQETHSMCTVYWTRNLTLVPSPITRHSIKQPWTVTRVAARQFIEMQALRLPRERAHGAAEGAASAAQHGSLIDHHLRKRRERAHGQRILPCLLPARHPLAHCPCRKRTCNGVLHKHMRFREGRQATQPYGSKRV